MATRRSEMMEETRGKLIQAARKAFAEKGYANASMDDLTADVGLTPGRLSRSGPPAPAAAGNGSGGGPKW